MLSSFKVLSRISDSPNNVIGLSLDQLEPIYQVKSRAITIADTESRVDRDSSNWKLDPSVFACLNTLRGPLDMDSFVTRLTNQLPRFVSWRPDPEAEATDAFTLDWSQIRGYAFPPTV